jgi:hypothetical protein
LYALRFFVVFMWSSLLNADIWGCPTVAGSPVAHRRTATMLADVQARHGRAAEVMVRVCKHKSTKNDYKKFK